MEPLTPKQRQVLEFITARLDEGQPPSQQEMADHFGLVQNAAYQLVSYLRKGLWSIPEGTGAALIAEYLHSGETEGLISAKWRRYADPGRREHRGLGAWRSCSTHEDVSAAGRRRRMIDEGIMDGDLVVVQAGSTIADGEIGIVLLDDEATVKRVFLQKDRIALKPANRKAGYKTRYIKRFDKNVRILGKVVGCVRTSVK
jgi:repressor LexA